MQNREDDNFDLQLREHFAKELDGQLGRAPAAFARSSRRRPWRVAAAWTAGFAAAAAVALVVTFVRHQSTPPIRGVHPSIDQLAMTAVEYRSAWQTSDAGTVYLPNDDSPMRGIRSEQVEIVSWIDPATLAHIEVTIPHEEVTLVTLNSY